MYVENELNKSWKWILGIASALLLLPQLAMPELTSSEAFYGLMARNANLSGDLFSTAPQGHEVNHGHLYPWVVNFLGIFGVNEFTIRLPSILGLAMMIALASFITYKYGGRQSAIVAGICMLSSFAAVKMGTRGEENMFGAAFLSSSWLVWFQMSRDRKNWFKAWLYSLLLVSIAAFSLGYYVFILFYIPLVFLRKPTDVRKRMLLLPHYQAVGVIICIHFVIFLIVSNLDSTLEPALGISLGQTDHYTNDLFNFPFTAAVFLLPWTFFSWTPFCAAFEAMEKDHVLFHFLRTVVFSLFITFWIIPDSTPLSLIPVLPALAIMTGLHYQILVRRYHIYIRKLVRFILGLLAAANIALIVIFSLKLVDLGSEFIKGIALTDQWVRVNIIICGASVLLAALLLLKGRDYPVWIKIMCMVVVGHWCIISFNNIKDRDKISDKKVGRALSEQIPDFSVVYNFNKHPHDTVMYYLGNVRVHHLNNTLDDNGQKIPETLYVISGVKPPVSITSNPAHYNWTPISKKLEGDNAYFQAWKGTLKELPAFNP